MEFKQENTYILNLEGAYIYKAIKEEEKEIKEGKKKGNKKIGYNTQKKKKDKDGKDTKENLFSFSKLYSATMPYSLETIRAFEKYPEEVLDNNGKQYTKLFINVNFEKHYKYEEENKDGKMIPKQIKKGKVREYLYENGFHVDGFHYKMFKRGGSKARTASAIFVKSDMYDTLYKRCLLGLEFKENELCDLTSKNAYISLIMSGIIGTINIKKEEILIIDDVMGKKMKVKASVTERDKNDNIVVRDYDDFEVQNNMTDGQVLIDESKFEEYEILQGHSCALLREDFFKGAGFNTKMQKFWKENGIEKVYDMFRGWVDAKDIKLVITPSACKFLKFANKFESKKDCYLHWWNNIEGVFGVVKTDHVGNYGFANRLSYQMINSLELNYDEVKEIAKDEIHYIKMLKNNWDGDKCKKLSKKDKEEQRQRKNEMTYFMHYIGNNSLETSTGEMISSILSVNSNYRFTKQFKVFKNHQIYNYVQDVKKGKIRISNSIYSILFSCPFTMLKQTTQQEMVTDCISSGWEVWCENYKDKQELCMIRNPQINSGNIAHVTNTYHDEYKWFNLSPFIVVLNTYDVDIMNRLQGCDFDIDSALLIENELIVKKAKECLDKYRTPINNVKGKTELKRDNMLELANLDNYLGESTRTIGQIVNKSAICNAYMWDAISKNMPQEYIDKLYDASSMLSSFSQIAIDMAKKSFLDSKGKRLSLLEEMKKINKWTYNDETILKFNIEEVVNEETGEVKLKNNGEPEIIKKMIVPKFFDEIANGEYRQSEFMECGMDYLQQVMDNELGKTFSTPLIDPKTLINVSIKGEDKPNLHSVKKAYELISKCNGKLKWCLLRSTKEAIKDSVLEKIRRNTKVKCINKLKELNLNINTILLIIKRALGVLKEKDTNFSGMTNLVLSLLYNTDSIKFLKCFKSDNVENDKVLIKDENGAEIIFGEKYSIVTKKDLE